MTDRYFENAMQNCISRADERAENGQCACAGEKHVDFIVQAEDETEKCTCANHEQMKQCINLTDLKIVPGDKTFTDKCAKAQEHVMQCTRNANGTCKDSKVIKRQKELNKIESAMNRFPKHKCIVLTELIEVSLKNDVGAHMVSTKAGDFKEEHERELQQAVDEAEERATRELKAALRRLKDDKEDERKKALQKQKEYYEQLAIRIEEQRNRAEQERERELRKKFHQEKEEALAAQWVQCERIKEEAVALACEKLARQMRAEFVIEKEEAVAEALRIAKEKYLIREKAAIEKTRRECEEEARIEAERVAKIHEQDIERCNQRYRLLEKKWHREIEFRQNVEQDFRDLQDDYRRFMDYTDGMFHSDYLLQLRHLGKKLADKQISAVTYEDIEKQEREIE